MTYVADPAGETRLPPEPPPRRPMSAGFWIALAVGVAFIALAVIVALFGPKIWPAKRVQPVAATAHTLSAPDPAAAALRNRIAELEADLAEARRAVNLTPVAADAAALSALNARIERLEAAQLRSGRGAAAAVAAGALADAAATSRPFTGELASLERLMPDSTLLQGLRPLAALGAPTRQTLAAEFPEAAARAAAAAHAPGRNASPFDRALAALGAIITFRRIDRLTGDGVDARLARAERRVEEGDLEGALAEMNRLPPAALNASAAWRDRAARRVAIDQRIAALRATALRDLAFEAAAPAAATEVQGPRP